jgi:hypothetical protein
MCFVNPESVNHVPRGSSSHCSILIKTPLAGKAGWENDLSIAPIATMDLTIYKFDQLGHYHLFHQSIKNSYL